VTAEQAKRIARTAGFARDEMRGDSSGHDWRHAARVRTLAVWLAGREHADPYVADQTGWAPLHP
jgi:HD superfamily phosphodiesterase